MVLNNVAVSIFGLDIYWYGITYVIGFLFSYFFLLRFSNEFGFKKEIIEEIFPWFILFSVLFGRIFHIIFYEPNYYLNHLFEIIRFDHGGMSIHGGFFGGFLVLYYFSNKYELNLFKLMDLFVLPAGFALALGRLANFLNQEIVGTITSSSIGVIFPKFDTQYRWPVALFESIKNIFVFEFLLYLFFIKNLHKKPGMMSALFLILFNFIRFFIDFFRIQEVSIGFISMGQLLSLVFGFLGVILFLKVKN